MSIVDLVETSKRRKSLPPPPVARTIRLHARLSQGEMAETIGVTGACISRWESGSRKPRGHHADEYSEVLARLARELLG